MSAVIVDYGPDLLRFEDGRPVAAGKQELLSPSQEVRTPAGYWALYPVGDEVLVVHPWRPKGLARVRSLRSRSRSCAVQGPPNEIGERLRTMTRDAKRADDRAAAQMLLRLVDPGSEDPGRAPDVPRSLSDETGLPPTYPLSGPRNVPTGPTGSASGSTGPDTPPE